MGAHPLARTTVQLWSSLTRAFYKEVYGFKFYAKSCLYNGGDVRVGKETAD